MYQLFQICVCLYVSTSTHKVFRYLTVINFGDYMTFRGIHHYLFIYDSSVKTNCCSKVKTSVLVNMGHQVRFAVQYTYFHT